MKLYFFQKQEVKAMSNCQLVPSFFLFSSFLGQKKGTKSQKKIFDKERRVREIMGGWGGGGV